MSTTTNAPPSETTGLSLAALVENLLFVADGPVSTGQLANALAVTASKIKHALEELAAHYAGGGLALQYTGERVQLTTHPGAAAAVENFLGLQAGQPLTKAALETLAIITYQQPITRPQIDALRGVNSDSVLKSLLTKGLIQELGRSEGPGRPILYGTTSEFLQHFGLRSLDEMPYLDLSDLLVPGPDIENVPAPAQKATGDGN